MEPPPPPKRRPPKKTEESSGAKSENDPIKKPRQPKSTSDVKERRAKENVEQSTEAGRPKRKKADDPNKGQSEQTAGEVREKPRRPKRPADEATKQETEEKPTSEVPRRKKRRADETKDQEVEEKPIPAVVPSTRSSRGPTDETEKTNREMGQRKSGGEMDTAKRPSGGDKLPVISKEPAFRSNVAGRTPKPKSSHHPPATFTGFRELSIGRVFLVTLLWLPRFFIPWIAAWHEFNVYILSNPYHWDPLEGTLQKQELYMFAGKCAAAILCSAVVDVLMTKKNLDVKYYIYLVLLMLFTFSPVIGGLVDVLLRAQFVEKDMYTNWWLSSVILMKWASSFSFIMFPVMFACIYDQNNNMSRNAHYNWTGVFVLLEFVNSYAAYWVIPGYCPTQEWTQIVIWVGIGFLLSSVALLSLIFFFVVDAVKYAMVMCYNCCRKSNKRIVQPIPPEPFLNPSNSVKIDKLKWFSMIAAPVVYSYFVFAVLERFEPDDDWGKHMASSASSMFIFGKMIGVVLMVLAIFVIRKVVKRYYDKFRLKAEMMVFGLPHVFSILALLTLVGRFATLSQLNEGDIIVGPIPDDDKAVFVFVNSAYRNSTICVTSDYFPPFKIKPRRHVTRELYSDSGVTRINFTVQVDPCSAPGMKRSFLAENFTNGDWRVYQLSQFGRNFSNLYIWDFYRRIYEWMLEGVEKLRPKAAPLLVIFSTLSFLPPGCQFYQLNHSSSGSFEVLHNNTKIFDTRDPAIWEVPATGTWTINPSSVYYNLSHESWAWSTNATLLPTPLQFEIENYSLYLMVEHLYREATGWQTPSEWWYNPPSHLQYPGFPQTYMIFKLAEIAGPGSDRLPSKKELQKDWAIKISMTLAGIAAGGIFLGFIYFFWVDPPLPHYRTISLAICWSLMGLAVEIPRIKLVDIGVKVSLFLLGFQILFTGAHVAGSYFMYTQALNLRKRPD